MHIIYACIYVYLYIKKKIKIKKNNKEIIIKKKGREG